MDRYQFKIFNYTDGNLSVEIQANRWLDNLGFCKIEIISYTYHPAQGDNLNDSLSILYKFS